MEHYKYIMEINPAYVKVKCFINKAFGDLVWTHTFLNVETENCTQYDLVRRSWLAKGKEEEKMTADTSIITIFKKGNK